MENKIFKIEVGQEVFLRPIGNNKRSWDGKPVPGRISKIARKYFYVSVNGHTWSDERFDREDFSCDERDRNAGYVIYESEEAFRRDVECEIMRLKICGFFGRGGGKGLPYEAVKQIHDILSYEDVI